MPDDLRISSAFPYHFKTKKLKRVAGYEGVFGLISLWCYCRTNRPKGDLFGLSDPDIEIICGVDTKRLKKVYESFASCLCDCGFLDKTDTGYILHNWAKHQPFAFYADERSQKARDSVKKRWEKRLGNKQSDTKRIRNVSESDTKGYTPSPSPSPSPSPYKEILSFLNSKAERNFKPTRKTESLIRARFNEGFTLDDFKVVIEKKIASWGGDPQFCIYLRPSTLFGAKFEEYLNEPGGNGKRPAGNTASYNNADRIKELEKEAATHAG